MIEGRAASADSRAQLELASLLDEADVACRFVLSLWSHSIQIGFRQPFSGFGVGVESDGSRPT